MKDKVKNKKLTYLIAVLVVLLLICIGVNVYRYLKSHKKEVTYLSTFEDSEEVVVEIKPTEEEQKNEETVQEKEYKLLSDIDVNIFTFKDETLTLERSSGKSETINIIGKISKQKLDDYLIKYRGYSVSYNTTTEPDYIVLTESSFYINYGDETDYRCYAIMYLFSQNGNGYLTPVTDAEPGSDKNSYRYWMPYFMSYDKKYILEADHYDESHGYSITYDKAVKYGVIEDKKGYSFS